MKVFDYADLGERKSWDYSMKGLTPEDDGILPILETDRELHMGEVLLIKNIAYFICSMSGKGNKNNIAYVRKLDYQKVFVENEEPEDRDYTENITCPYCGCQINDNYLHEDEDDKYECPCCQSVFAYQRNVTVEYCSQPVKKSEAIILN